MNLSDIKDLVKFIKSNKIKEFYYKKGDEEVSFKLGIEESPEQVNASKARRGIENGQLKTQIAGAEQTELSVLASNAARGLENGVQPASISTETNGVHRSPSDGIKKGNENLREIVSPFVGSFYRSSGPDSPPFVEIGSVVEKNSPVCIIEAMKIMNEIEVDMKCRIVSVLAENGQLVEYNQPLFLVEPL